MSRVREAIIFRKIGRQMQKSENVSATTVKAATLDRRDFLAGSAVAGVTFLLPGAVSAATGGKKTFTILHTNDLHSNLIGMAPASDYSPVHAQRGRDPRRVCAPSHVDREAEGGTQ